MARTFLKRIRVASWEELRERILQGIGNIIVNPTAGTTAKQSQSETPAQAPSPRM